MREATHGEFNIREMNSGSIEVWHNGVQQSPSMPVLRSVAAALDINTVNGQGNELNTRTLGRSLLNAMEAVRS